MESHSVMALATFPQAKLNWKRRFDHLMLYPHGLGGDSFNFQTEYSEDLVNWSILPSYIRDTVVSGSHRYYRIIKLPEPEIY